MLSQVYTNLAALKETLPKSPLKNPEEPEVIYFNTNVVNTQDFTLPEPFFLCLTSPIEVFNEATVSQQNSKNILSYSLDTLSTDALSKTKGQGEERNLIKIPAANNEAEVVVNEESSNLQQLQQTVQFAMKAAQQAQAELKLYQTSMQLTQGNAANSQQALEGIQQQLTDKEQLVEAAKTRVEQLNKDLRAAKGELAKTRESAKKADASATEAKANINKNSRRRRKRAQDCLEQNY